MVWKVIYIKAKTLENARKIARKTQILNIKSGKYIKSEPLYKEMKTYSFKPKK